MGHSNEFLNLTPMAQSMKNVKLDFMKKIKCYTLKDIINVIKRNVYKLTSASYPLDRLLKKLEITSVCKLVEKLKSCTV